MEVLDEREWALRVWRERRSRRHVREAEKSRVLCKVIREPPPNAKGRYFVQEISQSVTRQSLSVT